MGLFLLSFRKRSATKISCPRRRGWHPQSAQIWIGPQRNQRKLLGRFGLAFARYVFGALEPALQLAAAGTDLIDDVGEQRMFGERQAVLFLIVEPAVQRFEPGARGRRSPALGQRQPSEEGQRGPQAVTKRAEERRVGKE